MTLADFRGLPLLLTQAQVCAALGCDRETLRVLRGEHKELGVKLGKQWRYRKVTVAKLARIGYE